MSAVETAKEVLRLAEREEQGDKTVHLDLLNSIQRLQNAVTDPAEKMVRMRFQPYLNVSVRLGQEYGFLEALARAGSATAGELSQATKVDELLIVRLMRIITIHGMAVELGASHYAANDATHFIIKKGIVGDVKYYTDIVMRVCSHVGPLARDGKFPGENPHTHVFGKPMFPYMAENLEYQQAFADFMTARRAATWERWYDVYPLREKEAAVAAKDTDVLLVDVAGGQGFWTQELRRAHPDLHGRLIVQDQPQVISGLDMGEGIEKQAYDFFTPQPVQAAGFYYFKQILHNWDDEKAIRILSNTAAAMGPSSTLLINDFVLPDAKVGLRAAYMDMAMLVLLGACERTEVQWKNIIEPAGLKLVKIWFGAGMDDGSEAVLECVKA